MSKLNKKPRTREEIITDMRKRKDFKDKMDFTKNKFFPALVKATTSIEDAQQNLSVITNVMMEKVLGWMKERNMSELKLQDMISKDDPKGEDLIEMISLFDDMKVFDAKYLLEGMKNEITFFLNEENRTRSLSDLKVKWLDEIKP